ncbi:carbon monoxide dehydrogenase small subunit [Hyphomonas johnsonii MHS-2]|uniref:Carbon monoxide dehydrogenase small subunit n=1 Tax=Hyphomonas johnsonii MHS-2 TaxID=1280950 RepID=A0A059FUI5_9PROT|nr:(2Fe-2S)-binding protein [Hyphomonas johnsonii]KCZ94272.1 carbon monoxide dehydrogenase small subunit [Hyphomonas johnsonii MHS-2]
MPTLTLAVNGNIVTREVTSSTLLVQFLRDQLGLTGTHVGCDSTQCGACTVHLNGDAIKSCTALALSCDGGKVTTIEGLAQNGKLHPMQEAFRANHGLQCGYCTPGFVMAAVKIAERLGPNADEETLREEMDGNLCRCTGYQNIVKSIRAGAKAMLENEARDEISSSPQGLTDPDARVCNDAPQTQEQSAERKAQVDVFIENSRGS